MTWPRWAAATTSTIASHHRVATPRRTHSWATHKGRCLHNTNVRERSRDHPPALVRIVKGIGRSVRGAHEAIVQTSSSFCARLSYTENPFFARTEPVSPTCPAVLPTMTHYPRFVEAPFARRYSTRESSRSLGRGSRESRPWSAEVAGQIPPTSVWTVSRTLAAAREDPNGFGRRGAPGGLMIIDEIQRASELMLAIKLAVDEDQRPGQYLITGAADIRTVSVVQDSLAGRIEVLELLPFSQDEIAGVRSTFLPDAFCGRLREPARKERGGSLVHRVAIGGFPEALARLARQRRRDWFRAYVRAMVEHDVPDVMRPDRPDTMRRLVEILAQHCGELLNHTELGTVLGMDRTTVERHISVLEQTFLVRRVQPWFRNELSRLSKRPKLHFLDAGVAGALRRFNEEKLGVDRSQMGPLVETFVFAELSKQASWCSEPPRLYHYRDHAGGEIDFILESWDRRVVAIEVKAGATVRADAFATMKKLSAVLKEQFVLGVVLYDGTQAVSFGENLWAMPISTLWSHAPGGNGQ